MKRSVNKTGPKIFSLQEVILTKKTNASLQEINAQHCLSNQARPADNRQLISAAQKRTIVGQIYF